MIAFMRFSLLLALLAGSLTLAPPVASAQPSDSSEAARLREAMTVFNEIMSAEDQSIPRSILGKAEGIAIFPNTIKGGFIVGAQRGKGVISARTSDGWSSPAFMTITGGSVGLQIGGQAADLILVIMQRRGLESLVKNQFKLGADIAVAAGPVGRDAQASTDLQLRAEILSYSRARGLFAGVSLDGTALRIDNKANQAVYGRDTTARAIFEGRANPPSDAVVNFRDALEEATVKQSDAAK